MVTVLLFVIHKYTKFDISSRVNVAEGSVIGEGDFAVYGGGQYPAGSLKSGILIASPNSDQRVIVPFLHIAAVETTSGRDRSSRRRGGA